MRAFSTWMDATCLPFMRAFMGRNVDSVICVWDTIQPVAPRYAHLVRPSDHPVTDRLEGPKVTLENNDTRVAYGLNIQPWHSNHTTLQLHTVLPTIAPRLTKGMLELRERIALDPVTFTLTFDTYTSNLRVGITITSVHHLIYTNAQDFTTLADMEKVANTVYNRRQR